MLKFLQIKGNQIEEIHNYQNLQRGAIIHKYIGRRLCSTTGKSSDALHSRSDLFSSLPPWNVIHAGAKTYLQFCDCQPLPLFHRPTFLQSLQHRDPEILFSVLALAQRFDHGAGVDCGVHTEAARARVSKRVSEGKVDLSTIQTLCLLTLLDFAGKDSLSRNCQC